MLAGARIMNPLPHLCMRTFLAGVYPLTNASQKRIYPFLVTFVH